MKLCKIDYAGLSPKQKEIYNFQKISAVLADYGFNCIKLADDWQGADFLAYHRDGVNTLKVQLKGRLTISKKYQNKNLFVAFPLHGQWYLVDHDVLVAKVSEHTNWLSTDSWKSNGCYHAASPSESLLQSLAEYKL